MYNIKQSEEFFTENGFKVPKYDKERIVRDKIYAEEIADMLDNEYDNNSFAMDIREFIVFAAKLVPIVCDGKYNKVLKMNTPDLKGYDVEVKRNICLVKRDTIMIAQKVNSSDLGSVLGYVFKLIKIFGIPLFTVYDRNKKKEENLKRYSNEYDEMTSEEESEEESESE